MKRLLNTLYVGTQGSYLARDGDTVAVRVEGETKLRVPVHTLGGIVCFGQVSCSPFLMGLCAESGVALSFLTEYGRFLARVTGGTSGNVLLRKAQYVHSDDPSLAAEVARGIVAAKIANSRSVLLRGAREAASEEAKTHLAEAAEGLKGVLLRLQRAESLDTLRGHEGEAARTYFGAFGSLIALEDEAFRFTTRSRRPPKDPVNTLLSFLYTLLTHDARGACEAVGLDPAVGFLHRDRPGRPGLALDLVEEFRACVVDRLALTLINRRQLKPKGFKTTESGAVHMNDDTRKAVLVAYQERKQDEVSHPYLGEKMPIGLLVHAQALLMARYIRGDLDAYPAYVWR
jgi:CRISPR-associated protein Cas1